MKRFAGHKDPDRREDARRHHGLFVEYVESGHRDGERLAFDEYRKTQTTLAVKMTARFEVDTPGGLHTGKAGDWLAIGVSGEMYPIDAEVFAVTYELANPVHEDPK